MKRKTKTETAAKVPEDERISYVRTFDGQWPRVSEWIEVVVEPRHAGGWWAYGSTGFPNHEREQWNTRKSFDSRDDAARFAADYLAKAEELVAAIERGETPFFPHRVMAAACTVAVEQDSTMRALRAKGRDASLHELQRAREAFQHDWYRSHDWRDFDVRRPEEMPGWVSFASAVAELAAPAVADGKELEVAIEDAMRCLLDRQHWQLLQLGGVYRGDGHGLGPSPAGREIVATIAKRVWEDERRRHAAE